jgi:CDP-paratose 2-epimerase
MADNYLITGGAGFIGSNYAKRLIERGEKVTIFDNLSRKGAHSNLNWIESETGQGSFEFIKGDIRDQSAIEGAAYSKDVIVHLAAQVAVTTSVSDPRTDFDINALGTFNVLEAAKNSGRQPIVLYASTNKVYGGLKDLEIVERETRYEFNNHVYGIGEEQSLDFHSPYGCSKGAGDQYTRDYYRMYEIPSVVFRQSCIYGTRQFGIEDQGWVAWFVIAAQQGIPLTIYGDGKQVRDILFIDDLLDAYDAAILKIDSAKGKIFNVGGGKDQSISIWMEFSKILEKALLKNLEFSFKDWRPGDQKVYISDIRKINRELGWKPLISIERGVKKLAEWVKKNQALFV